MSDWSVEKLNVFQKAYALSLELHLASKNFPKDEQIAGVADQLRRASKSIPALIAEGAGRGTASDREFKRYCVMALGSCEEAKLWCSYAADLGYASRRDAEAWRERLSEIGRMLHGLIKRLSDG